jgi:hypothetical protein
MRDAGANRAATDPQPVPDIDPADRGAADAAIRGFAQGVTFGFADEIGAAIDASLAPVVNWFLPQGAQRLAEPDWSSRYDDALAVGRQMDKAAEKFHPTAQGLGTLAGGFATVPFAPEATLFRGFQAAANASRFARLGALGSRISASAANSAITGGAYGGFYGLGSTDGDFSKRLGGAGEDALWGGLLGGAIGLPLSAVGEALAARAARSAPGQAAQHSAVSLVPVSAEDSVKINSGDESTPLFSPADLEAVDRIHAGAQGPSERIGAKGTPSPSAAQSVTLARPLVARTTGGPAVDAPRLLAVSPNELADLPEVTQAPLARAQYPSPSRMSAKMEPVIANPNVYNGIVDYMKLGRDMGGASWLDAAPIRLRQWDALGPEDGEKAYRELVGYVAASSPMTKPPQNVRIGTLIYAGDRNGLPVLPGQRLEYPYGSPANRTHLLLAESARAGRWNSLTRPKTASMFQNLLGNMEPAVIDRHILRLVSILHGHPGYLTKIDPRDYWALEELIGRASKEVGLSPGEGAQALRFGGACLTGLCINDGSRSFLHSVADRLVPTSEYQGISVPAARNGALRGRFPLRTVGWIPIAGGALAAGYAASQPGGPSQSQALY